MAQLDGLAAEQRAAVEHCREQLKIFITGMTTARGFTEETVKWAAEKGFGKNSGLFFTAAQSAMAAGDDAVLALTQAEEKLELFSRALYDMGA
jgi:hypothetical protein